MARDLLLEVGAEEIPASFIGPALEDLKRVITERMTDARLKHGEVRTFGTPRRLAVWVKDVADAGEDIVKEVLGPSAKAAFDAQGKPTKAAEKFAEGLKLTVEQLGRATTPKGEYVSARVEEKGRPAADILKDALHVAVHSINFRKSMRWGDVDTSFARPVQWLVALLGNDVLPVVFGDVTSGRATRGHRFLSPGAIELKAPADYEAALEKAHVVADIAKRRAQLVEKVKAAASKAGAQLLEDEALVDQVTNLVELPSPVVGTFEERHLDLPPEVLVQEMKSHQRYFSLVDGAGKLQPKFIAVSNTPVRDEQLSLRGYQRVLRARLADGRFFFDEDRKTPLIDRVEKLGRVVWQGQLGSYLEKVERFRSLALWLAQQTGRAGDAATIERGATLAKADLVTGMVGEFPELQGIMAASTPARAVSRTPWRWPSRSTTCRVAPRTRCPHRTRARSSASRTAWTRCAASSPLARRPRARRTRSPCAARASPSSGWCWGGATASACRPPWTRRSGCWPRRSPTPSARPASPRRASRCWSSSAAASKHCGASSTARTWWRRCCRPASTTWWPHRSAWRR